MPKIHIEIKWDLIVPIFVILTFSGCICLERKLSSYVNPNCTGLSFCENTTLVHIEAEGPNDTLHYVWSFLGKPSVLIALTNHSTKLHIVWDDFIKTKNHSLYFTQEPLYTFGLVISKVLEYNDVNDTAYLDIRIRNTSYLREYETENFLWNRTSFKNDTKNAVLTMETSEYLAVDNSTGVKSGKIQFVFSGFGYEEHSEDLPRLLHTANSTQIDMIVDHFVTYSGFPNSRFAVSFVLVGNKLDTHSKMVVDAHKSLDDEQAPGVFTIVDLQTPQSLLEAQGGYLQWRPVAYVEKVRELSNSTDVINYGMMNVTDAVSDLNNSMLLSYYDDVQSKLVQKTITSFGLKEDGFYKKTSYTSWTFMVGYGKPPNEEFSLLVILVISIGLGLPALLIFVSCIVLAIRRATQKNDELFLNR